MTARPHAVLVGVALLTCGVLAQDARRVPSGVEGPLPDKQALFVATRDNLARSERDQRFFAYKERRTEIRTNPFGRIGTGPTRVYDVVPLPDGAGFTRRILERDGKPVPDGEVERRERRNRGNGRPDRAAALDDAVSALDFKVERRERAGGRSLIVVKFMPRPDAKPQTREGRLAKYFVGDMWVDEDLHEIVRIEATATDTIAYGYGFIARLNEGTRITVTREQVEQNLWLPVSVRFKGEGRALLFRKLNLDYSVDWFDYRRIVPN